jgi:hypothetical protein
MMFPDTLDPTKLIDFFKDYEPYDRYPVSATRRYNPMAVPIEVTITAFISFSSRISFAIVNI